MGEYDAGDIRPEPEMDEQAALPPQKRHRVAKNAAWLISGRIAQSLLALVVGALTARYLGPSNFGSINYAASLTAFIAPIDVPVIMSGLIPRSNKALRAPTCNAPRAPPPPNANPIVLAIPSSFHFDT